MLMYSHIDQENSKKRDGMLISDKENGTKLYEDGMPIAEIMVIPDMQ